MNSVLAVSSGAQSLTLLDVVDVYLDAKQGVHSEGTRRSYTRGRKLLAEVGGSRGVIAWDEVAAQRAYDLIAEAHGAALADVSAKVAKAAWNWAARRGFVHAGNPWRGLERAPRRARPLFFEAGWLPSMLRVVDDAIAGGAVVPHAGRFLAVALATGARPWCEVLALRVEDLDWRADQILIRKGKGSRPRTIPMAILGDVGRQVLEAQASMVGSGWLWPSPLAGGDRMSEGPPRYAWPTVLERAAAQGLRTTTLEGKPLDIYSAGRHAVAHFAVCQLGLSVGHVAAILGHRSEETLRTYAHLSSEHARPTAKLIGDAYDEARASDSEGSWGVDPAAIRAVRLEAGLSQPQFGERLGGLPKQKISQWERGTQPPTVAELHRLAVTMGRSIESFLFRAPRSAA